MNLKAVSLFALIVQTTTLVLLLRYSRTRSATSSLYINSTAIVMSELLKAIFSLCLMRTFNSKSEFSDVIKPEGQRNADFMKLAIPALLYTLQNNLLFLALSNLDAATYQVTYQFKILTTALFSVLMLKKTLSKQQWFSLILLTIGVAFVQYPSDVKPRQNASRLLGFVAVTFACLSSGFAGVYFEKMIKMPGRSVWIQNFYLAVYSTMIGLTFAFTRDYERILDEGFFVGYDSLVWTVVFLQAIGGLVIAAVIKYADNIIKGFAASLSIIVSSLASYFILDDFKPSFLFVLGTFIVILSTFIYGQFNKKKDSEPTHSIPYFRIRNS